MRICLCLISCIFFFANLSAAQTCKPLSIPATTPDSQLTDNGDSTITDLKTGLMWKQCLEGVTGSDCATGTATSFNWQEALAQPGVVNSGGGFAGYTDWRLPNIKELASIVEEQCYSPAINVNYFSNTEDPFVWSGSPDASYSGSAWFVDFDDGVSYDNGRDYFYQVRLVRGGQ